MQVNIISNMPIISMILLSGAILIAVIPVEGGHKYLACVLSVARYVFDVNISGPSDRVANH